MDQKKVADAAQIEQMLTRVLSSRELLDNIVTGEIGEAPLSDAEVSAAMGKVKHIAAVLSDPQRLSDMLKSTGYNLDVNSNDIADFFRSIVPDTMPTVEDNPPSMEKTSLVDLAKDIALEQLIEGSQNDPEGAITEEEVRTTAKLCLGKLITSENQIDLSSFNNAVDGNVIENDEFERAIYGFDALGKEMSHLDQDGNPVSLNWDVIAKMERLVKYMPDPPNIELNIELIIIKSMFKVKTEVEQLFGKPACEISERARIDGTPEHNMILECRQQIRDFCKNPNANDLAITQRAELYLSLCTQATNELERCMYAKTGIFASAWRSSEKMGWDIKKDSYYVAW